ncbi:MAG: hypothetical protein K9N49_04025 [Candidatus Marinimicrobia bacterium]|nr:hypothetical protein [Candidatus Neomarinimicrobiota bacterium]
MNEQDNLSPDLQSSILCDDVRQERNGKFILIGLFDAIGAPSFPLKYPRLFMVNRWCSGAGEFTQQTRIMKPDQHTVLIAGKEIPVRLPHPEATATNVEIFLNVTFAEAGTHWVEVMLNGRMLIRYPLRVAPVQPGRPQTNAEPPPG